MSIENVTFHDQHQAGLTGMGHFNGDPEVAEDLGIATDPEQLYGQIKAGEQVGALLASRDELPTPDFVAHQEWVDSFHLSHPSSEFGMIPRKSAEERAATTANIEAVRSRVRPLGDRPTRG